MDSHFALLFSSLGVESRRILCPVALMVVFSKGWAEECTHLCLWNELTRTYASGLVDANETRLLLRLFSVAGFLE